MEQSPYRSQLEDLLVAVTTELEQIAVHNDETDDWVAKPPAVTDEADLNVAADTNEAWYENRSLMTPLETRYRNVKRALQKMEEGTYGVCEISGEPIEPERLAANPAARTNIANREREGELPV